MDAQHTSTNNIESMTQPIMQLGLAHHINLLIPSKDSVANDSKAYQYYLFSSHNKGRCANDGDLSHDHLHDWGGAFNEHTHSP